MEKNEQNISRETLKQVVMKKWMLLGCLIISKLSFGQEALGEIVGTVIDHQSNDTLIGAQVFVIDQDLYSRKTVFVCRLAL